jgi:hypothetical protein
VFPVHMKVPVGRTKRKNVECSCQSNRAITTATKIKQNHKSHIVEARRRESETEIYKAEPRMGSNMPFSAFWLRSSFVSVLISLISDTWPNGRVPTTVACYWVALERRPCVAPRAWRTLTQINSKFVLCAQFLVLLKSFTLVLGEIDL